MPPQRVLLLEFNEITWTIIDPLIARGKLPNLARMRREGTWAAPVAPEQPPHLDPWVTWVTVHTGVEQEVHGATVLEQDADTIRAKRTWDHAVEAGKSVGIFGSISAFPPRPVPGFMIPGPFAPADTTFPPYLAGVQALNREHTKIHAKVEDEAGLLEMVQQGTELLRYGLRPSTCARIAYQLGIERVQPHLRWKRVALQPLVNYDFFASLYQRYRPDFATWHTNHAAHYMHHYWRAHDDAGFLVSSPPEEKAKYGEAVSHGYEICDELLGRFLRLAGDDAVVVLASSMGQQPYVKNQYPEGRVVLRFKDVRRVLAIVGATDVSEIVHTMVPQVNVRIPDAAVRARTRERLERCYRSGAEPGGIGVDETGEILTLTPSGLARYAPESRYFFPDAPGADPRGHALEDLFVADTPTPKQGYHHPTGILMMHGPGIRRGHELREVSTLDIAPTLLTLLGVPVPPAMTGQVLSDAWAAPPR